MEARIDEIASGVYRLSIFAPETAPPAGLTYNHFLISGDEPLLFHCGKRKMFPLVSAAVARIMPVQQLRWLAFGHFEADECGSMNEWLEAAPTAELTHGMVGCRVSISDMADRPPRMLSSGEVIDIGGKRLRYIDTPHVPHGWDAGVMFEETTGTLLCGDLFLRSRTATSSDPQLGRKTYSDTPALDRPQVQRFASSPTLSRKFWPQCTARHIPAMVLLH